MQQSGLRAKGGGDAGDAFGDRLALGCDAFGHSWRGLARGRGGVESREGQLDLLELSTVAAQLRAGSGSAVGRGAEAALKGRRLPLHNGVGALHLPEERRDGQQHAAIVFRLGGALAEQRTAAGAQALGDGAVVGIATTRRRRSSVRALVGGLQIASDGNRAAKDRLEAREALLADLSHRRLARREELFLLRDKALCRGNVSDICLKGLRRAAVLRRALHQIINKVGYGSRNGGELCVGQ